MRRYIKLVEQYVSPANQLIASMESFMAHYPYAKCVLALQDDSEVSLEHLRVHPLRQGIGSHILEKLVSLADQLQITIWLTAAPLNASIDKAVLIAFYERFGFSLDPDSDEAMVRYPSV